MIVAVFFILIALVGLVAGVLLLRYYVGMFKWDEQKFANTTHLRAKLVGASNKYGPMSRENRIAFICLGILISLVIIAVFCYVLFSIITTYLL